MSHKQLKYSVEEINELLDKVDNNISNSFDLNNYYTDDVSAAITKLLS